MDTPHAAGEELTVHLAQPGIAPFPDYAQIATFTLKPDAPFGHKEWIALSQEIHRLCEKEEDLHCVLGVDFTRWSRWCEAENRPLPKGMVNHDQLKTAPFAYTGGDLLFHIKGDSEVACAGLFYTIEERLEPVTKKVIHTKAAKRHGGKVFGGRFMDAMVNPGDPVNLSHRVLVGKEDPDYAGGAYVIEQKFVHNWDRLDQMSMVEKENMIGRNHADTIIPDHDHRSHIKCARQQGGEGVTHRIFRQALPFGDSPTGMGKEEGVHFIAYASEGKVYESIIHGIRGPEHGFIRDKMLNTTLSHAGNFWFVPPAKDAGLEGPKGEVDVPLNSYFDLRSENGVMYYNGRDYLHQIQKQAKELALSDRIIRLIGQTFSQWNDTWAKKVVMPPLGHLADYVKEARWKEYEPVAQGNSVALRKGLSIKISLSDALLREQYRKEALLYTIKPGELIVGNMPPLSLGTGTVVMEYLHEAERLQGFFATLNEYSATGHNLPNYRKVLALGVPGLLEEAKGYLANATDDNREFYQSALWSLEGLQAFILAYADLAEETAKAYPYQQAEMARIKKQMTRLAHEKPQTMHDALQLIFLVNCALHQVGEPMSIGRLDQFLIDFYNRDMEAGRLDEYRAQELIDAFWLKMDETVVYNIQNMQDYLNYGTGAVFYSAGNFPQGAALNQWVQQVTVGGYLPEEGPAKDACNQITLFCLRSARRLPLNAPCLSLRVHGKMDGELHDQIFKEAALALLSNGGHPVLLNDDKLCKGLEESGPLTAAHARDYACDGCYEPIVTGKSEWAFSYVPILPAVGMAMNQGTTIEGAGWVHLRGNKVGWNSPAPEKIATFEEFIEIFYTQYQWLIAQFFHQLYAGYGSLGGVCPSPLFSPLVDGCMESGRDMTNGGADYHIVAPMLCGITNAIDSLYAVKKLVFDRDTALTTLPELRYALWNNWGEEMQEPFQSALAGTSRAEANALRLKELRSAALALPKFGEGKEPEVAELGQAVVARCVEIIRNAMHATPELTAAYEALQEKYGTPERPFRFTVTPGVGTFEDNLGLGLGMGASPDGRLSGQPVADDFCAAPTPADLPATGEPLDLYSSLEDWNCEAIGSGLANAAPIDLNMAEDTTPETMEALVRAFAKGAGSNLITVTVADLETYRQAVSLPEKYDLVRVRMGGWSEFFISMFPQHQQYIMRRRYYQADPS